MPRMADAKEKSLKACSSFCSFSLRKACRNRSTCDCCFGSSSRTSLAMMSTVLIIQNLCLPDDFASNDPTPVSALWLPSSAKLHTFLPYTFYSAPHAFAASAALKACRAKFSQLKLSTISRERLPISAILLVPSSCSPVVL